MQQVNELWMPVKGFESLYLVSNLGEVFSLEKEKHTPQGKTFISKRRKLNPSSLTNGYLSITLCNNGKSTKILLHRLVAIHFNQNPLNKDWVNHVDGVKTNCCSYNLEWCSPSENMIHAFNSGLHQGRKKIKKNGAN